ncbi:hypothetical protein N7537_012306 [Penicillium hordei]|uniref:Uncharacterized protein n=1 Tax=Penicillium hordei TaxID=40994 RepID=A0AAD6DNE4_9EURO|nr:uncharacterized protein N7537_012306 [Penicillium hordei]KAJ5589628.1 hypothetical protein N7537_012306 [Penicillium hordei]
MSQFSDAGPSSQYEGDTDSLSFPRSDDAYLIAAETPSSQQTIVSVSDSPFLRAPPPSIPLCLEYVVPSRTKSFILYSIMNKVERKFEWHGIRKHSTSWENLDQVAHISTGTSSVMCKRCGNILDHPNWRSNGTKSVNRHWTTNRYKLASSQKGQYAKLRQLFKKREVENFTKEQWEQQIIRTVTVLRLPFQVVENPELQMLCRLEFPSAGTRKKVHWKRSMLTALQAAREKLKDYYGKTTGDHSNLYAMGTVLHTAGMVR